MKKIYEFNGLNKKQKILLKKDYIKSEWKNFLISYIFILLSSSKPFLSITNGAIFVFIWYTLSILLAIVAYVSQNDYMYSKKRAVKYSKKHTNTNVEKGSYFSPEIGGWNFIAMQLLIAVLFYCVTIPISFYLQFKNFDTYQANYRNFFIGVFADTYIVVFFTGILQCLVDFVYDCSNHRVNIKTTFKIKTFKDLISCISSIVIVVAALIYYFNHEFEGLFGNTGKNIMGIIYIIYMLSPFIQCIIHFINRKK